MSNDAHLVDVRLQDMFRESQHGYHPEVNLRYVANGVRVSVGVRCWD